MGRISAAGRAAQAGVAASAEGMKPDGRMLEVSVGDFLFPISTATLRGEM
jgi:hypothetical protein